MPPIPESQAGNVLSLRTPADIHAILDLLHSGMRIVVVGVGYIGLRVRAKHSLHFAAVHFGS